jgi:hypothetical protein
VGVRWWDDSLLCHGLIVAAIAGLLKVNKSAINSYFAEMRKLFVGHCLRDVNFDSGKFEFGKSLAEIAAFHPE